MTFFAGAGFSLSPFATCDADSPRDAPPPVLPTPPLDPPVVAPTPPRLFRVDRDTVCGMPRRLCAEPPRMCVCDEDGGGGTCSMDARIVAMGLCVHARVLRDR